MARRLADRFPAEVLQFSVAVACAGNNTDINVGVEIGQLREDVDGRAPDRRGGCTLADEDRE